MYFSKCDSQNVFCFRTMMESFYELLGYKNVFLSKYISQMYFSKCILVQVHDGELLQADRLSKCIFFVKMYFSQNIVLKMYFSKCDSQNVFCFRTMMESFYERPGYQEVASVSKVDLFCPYTITLSCRNMPIL